MAIALILVFIFAVVAYNYGPVVAYVQSVRKQCPACRKVVDRQAVICPYCRTDLG